MKSIILARLIIFIALLAGCGKNETPPSAEPPPAKPAISVEPAAEAPPAIAEATAPKEAEPKEQTEPVSPMAYSDAAGLSLKVSEFYDKNGRVPKDLNELVTAKMLLRLPTPPPGMRYVIDAKNRSVLLVR